MNLEFETSDWSELFRHAHSQRPKTVPGTFDLLAPNLWPGNVASVVAKAEGSNYGDSWAIVVQTHDRLFYAVVGVCNATTGNGSNEWLADDCAVDVTAASTLEDAIRFGLGDSERSRMFPVIPADPA